MNVRMSRVLLLPALCATFFAMAAEPGMANPQQPHHRQDAAALMSAQRSALGSLAFLDGVWRGVARTTLADGSVQELVQTERVGPFLEGTLKVIEGRGYDAAGNVAFNALGIVSWDVARQRFAFRSYAMGQYGDFAFAPTGDGFTWEIPAGPATIRHAATVRDGVWHETGDRVVAGQAPVRFFEMTLHRIGDSKWPAAGAIPAATTIEGTLPVQVRPR